MATASGTGPPRTEVVTAPTTPPDHIKTKRRLTVLVVGTDDWAVDQSATVLEATGHRVIRCHEPGEPAFPCNALIQGRTCPLDVGFDVVLTARARPAPVPAQGEMGVICALHERTPLVAVGISEKNPFSPWSSATVGSDGDLAGAVENAAGTRLFDLRQERA